MAVNISPSHFLDNDFMPLIRHVIEETGIDPRNLELEVTENVVQTDPHNLSIFQQLKDLGILLSIDDFGIGYSSFASLKHLAVDYLKIDKYFVCDMLIDNKSQRLIGSMIEMGHILGHKIVVEGVETIEQYKILKNFGCEVVQGYLFSRPIDAETLTTLLLQDKTTFIDQNLD